MKASVQAIDYHLPEQVLTNEQLSAEFPEWSIEKIEDKTGIVERHIAAADETSLDLGVKAGEKVFSQGVRDVKDIDFLLFCTQTPDYYLPTSACIIQDRLGLPRTCGALDFNLGCSGYIYGLSLAKSLIESGQAGNVLLITAETYSKLVHPQDKSVRTIFGDGASATLVTGVEDEKERIGPFVFGTDGRGWKNLIVPTGGMRNPVRGKAETIEDESGNVRTGDSLFMDGAEIFTFTLSSVPSAITKLYQKSGYSTDDIDLFVFHQANKYMMDHLRKKMKIPEEKFIITLRNVGNTVSSTLPISLKMAQEQGRLKRDDRIVLAGYGVGYSWGAAILHWKGE